MRCEFECDILFVYSSRSIPFFFLLQKTMASTKLFANKICPFAHRALFVAAEKKLVASGKVEIVEVSLPTPQWYNEAVNPRKTVPCLQVLPSAAALTEAAEGKYMLQNTIPESTVCAEYLDDAFSSEGICFTPSDPRQRADVKVFISDCGAAVRDLYGLLAALGSGDEDKIKGKLTEVQNDLKFLEMQYVAQQKMRMQNVDENSSENKQAAAGPFFLGDKLSMAEVSLAPFLYRFQFCFKAFPGGVSMEDACAGAPSIYGMLKAVEARPGFLEYGPDPEEVVTLYAQKFGVNLQQKA